MKVRSLIRTVALAVSVVLISGGITGARGHQGSNRGRSFVVALARGELCSPTDTPVYGCALNDPQPDALDPK